MLSQTNYSVQRMSKNALKEIRESLEMSKAELARKANISPITITRIENGMPYYRYLISVLSIHLQKIVDFVVYIFDVFWTDVFYEIILKYQR